MAKDLDTPQHEALSQFLRLQRAAARLSQAELADRLGRRQSHVSKIENGGHRVSVVEFLRLAAVLGFDFCEVLRQIEAGTLSVGPIAIAAAPARKKAAAAGPRARPRTRKKGCGKS